MVVLRHVAAPEGVAAGAATATWLPDGGRLVGAGDAAAQARQVFGNLGRCLAAAGAASVTW